MTIYVDASALLKLYLYERDSEYAEDLLSGAGDWLTGRHTTVEVRRLSHPDLMVEIEAIAVRDRG